MKLNVWLGLLAGWLIAASLAEADVTGTDLQIAARALSFMAEPPRGVVRVGIVHAPSKPRSLRQAEEIRALLGRGLNVGNLELLPTMVPLADAGAADVDLFFLTEDMGTHDGSLSVINAARQIPCFTTDIAQVRAGACAVGVRSTPKVEILVHRGAAKASGMVFATVFRVMVTEL